MYPSTCCNGRKRKENEKERDIGQGLCSSFQKCQKQKNDMTKDHTHTHTHKAVNEMIESSVKLHVTHRTFDSKRNYVREKSCIAFK